MPAAPWDETELVSLSQLYGRFARIFDEDGVEFFSAGDVSWSETNVVQATARRPGAKAYYLLDEPALAQRVRDRTVAEMVESAPREARVSLADLPFDPPPGTVAAVRVVASITHTIGGLRVDERARVLREDGSPVDGLWAAGVDAGGVSTGGYASGLAQALVLGLAAAEDAAPPPEPGCRQSTRVRQPGVTSPSLPTEKTQGRVSPGSGEAPILLITSSRPSSSNSCPSCGGSPCISRSE